MSSIGKNNLCNGSQNNCSLWGGGRKVMSRRVQRKLLVHPDMDIDYKGVINI